MTERHDHRDAEARAADATADEVIDRPVMDGAADLQTEADRAIESERDRDNQDDEDAVGH
jgi:hypothetical protein